MWSSPCRRDGEVEKISLQEGAGESKNLRYQRNLCDKIIFKNKVQVILSFSIFRKRKS